MHIGYPLQNTKKTEIETIKGQDRKKYIFTSKIQIRV
jgi:hypothetical protein